MSTPSPRRTARLAAALLAPVLLLTGCTGMQGTGDLEYVEGDGQVIELVGEDRVGPVDLSGETVDGEDYDIADVRGSVVVVNVWWSGCGPCVTEMPMLTELDAAYDDEDVSFVGINIRDSSAENPSIYDPSSQTLLAFPGRATPRFPPTTLVLDAEGKVAGIINGAIPSRATLTTLVQSAGGPEAPERTDEPDGSA